MSDSARDMMMYDAQKKSIGVAYLLWFFLGSLVLLCHIFCGPLLR